MLFPGSLHSYNWTNWWSDLVHVDVQCFNTIIIIFSVLQVYFSGMTLTARSQIERCSRIPHLTFAENNLITLSCASTLSFSWGLCGSLLLSECDGHFISCSGKLSAAMGAFPSSSAFDGGSCFTFLLCSACQKWTKNSEYYTVHTVALTVNHQL